MRPIADDFLPEDSRLRVNFMGTDLDWGLNDGPISRFKSIGWTFVVWFVNLSKWGIPKRGT